MKKTIVLVSFLSVILVGCGNKSDMFEVVSKNGDSTLIRDVNTDCHYNQYKDKIGNVITFSPIDENGKIIVECLNK